MTSYSATVGKLNFQQLTLDDVLPLVEEHANEIWKQTAMKAVQVLCQTHKRITTDDIWDYLEAFDVHTKEHRALGAIMRNAAKKGWCRSSGDYVQSKRPVCHRRPIAIWDSCFGQ
jgi:hypothetical protein